jgi:AcrR family transcriptional regulator
MINTTEERILDSAHDLFFQYGIKSVTMDDIAGHLGMSKKTIYSFFDDKDKLVCALTGKEFETQQGDLEKIAGQSENAVREMLGIIQYLSVMFSKMNRYLIYDLQKYHPNAWKLFSNFKEECIVKVLQKNIRRGIKEELYRPEINPRILALLRVKEAEWALDTQVFPPKEFNTGDVHVQLLDHFLYGIVTLKGYKLIDKYKN